MFNLSIIKYCVKYRYIIAFILFAFLVVAKLHGSSIAYWDLIIKEKVNENEKTLLLGKVRGIRSDEWLIQTPMFFLQTETADFFPLINKNIRSDGQNMVISAYAPVFDLTILGKPFNWGFILFGKEYGLSWYWYSKTILLFLLSYELSMLLTNKNTLISIVGAFWITYSPAVQWWFNFVPDLLIFSQAIIVATWYYVNSDEKKLKLFLIGVLTSSIIGYSLTFYPPIQVPLGYLTIIFLLFIIYSNRSKINLMKYDYVLFGLMFIVIGLTFYSFFYKSLEAIKLLSKTVYPGVRFSNGGNFDVNYLQLYLIDWLVPYKEINFIYREDSFFLNQSEVSIFLNFLPAIIFVFFKVYNMDNEKKYFIAAIIGYLLFQISWLFVHYPDWFAKYTLFSYVTERRLQLTVSLTSLYLSIWVFSLIIKHKPMKWFESLFISLFILIIYSYSIKNTPMSDYLSPFTGLTLLLFFLLNFSFMQGIKPLFISLLTIFVCVGGLTVNPVSRGVGSIYNKTVSQKILEIKKKSPEQKWMAVNTHYLGNLLVALGVKTFNSMHYYPDLKMWKLLDTENRYEQIYNRNANVEVQFTEEKTHFKLPYPNNFILYLNKVDLKKTGVKYLLSNGPIKDNLFLKEIDRVYKDNIYIYEVSDLSRGNSIGEQLIKREI